MVIEMEKEIGHKLICIINDLSDNEIVDVFSKLDKVDTKGIEASMQPVELKNTLREDKEKKPFTQEEALSLTEHKRDGYFKGPRAV